MNGYAPSTLPASRRRRRSAPSASSPIVNDRLISTFDLGKAMDATGRSCSYPDLPMACAIDLVGEASAGK